MADYNTAMVQAGFNHNIRYQDILFHVQTEDYGVHKHVVVTQLFYGGTLVGKTQTDYLEFIGLEDMSEQILDMMKVQHTKMLKDLVNGKIDIPKWIIESEAPERETSKPTLNLDMSKEDTLEKTVEKFLEEKK